MKIILDRDELRALEAAAMDLNLHDGIGADIGQTLQMLLFVWDAPNVEYESPTGFSVRPNGMIDEDVKIEIPIEEPLPVETMLKAIRIRDMTPTLPGPEASSNPWLDPSSGGVL